jgi:hypothetical protein
VKCEVKCIYLNNEFAGPLIRSIGRWYFGIRIPCRLKEKFQNVIGITKRVTKRSESGSTSNVIN